MPDRHHIFSRNNLLLYGIALLLLPALLVHLGLSAFTDDEGIRALVALEMDISHNYLTPTMFGELYYNKPPLYNWILLAVYKLTGRTDEFISRLPTVFFLLAYAATVYHFFKKNIAPPDPRPSQPSAHTALLPPLALITCGRILFWDSMLGLIDTCFSWVMFSLFMVIYHEGEKGRYWRLFVLSYLLAAIGFMLKALPAVVFLGIALPVYFVWQKKWRHLFSWAHVAGVALFAGIVGSYYFLYARENGLTTIAGTIFHESAKRTFVEYGLWETVRHFFTFPFEMWFHFLPWTLLLVYFLGKDAWRHILRNKFITWNLLVFAATVLPYWSSVEVYPRYLFMHVPLVFSAFIYLHSINQKEKTSQWQLVEKTFFGLCILATISSLLPPFWPALQGIPYLWAKTAGLALGMGALTVLYWRWKPQRMLTFVLVLLVARLGFDWFVLPSRQAIDCRNFVRDSTLAAVEKLGGQPLYIYQNSLGNQPITGYYFTRETGQILTSVHHDFDRPGFYLVNTSLYPKDDFEELCKVRVKWECGELMIGRWRG
ncbi:MAG: glycosyltransferase family 39 protein [Lewinellaceae bacterium]|nr:glycosyltransferase family 39 protein [Saprospiraceae bacterium]MCB9339673.1 glycosyltransferase family 39 protein [Lewinellaceae bacterium]